MDISGVSIPVSHEAQQEPPRNAQLLNAMREPQPAEQQSNDAPSENSFRENTARRDDSESSLGRHVDEHA